MVLAREPVLAGLRVQSFSVLLNISLKRKMTGAYFGASRGILNWMASLAASPGSMFRVVLMLLASELSPDLVAHLVDEPARRVQEVLEL